MLSSDAFTKTVMLGLGKSTSSSIRDLSHEFVFGSTNEPKPWVFGTYYQMVTYRSFQFYR